MRLQIIPPTVQPEVYPEVTGCPDPGCDGRHVQLRQAVRKPLRDTALTEVVARRSGCLRCGRTCRLYPLGVDHDQTSARLKGVAVMFSVLGMSDGAVAAALRALGFPRSKVAVANSVQAAGAAVPGLRREAVRHGGGRVVALGADLTSVRCKGRWLTVGGSVDAVAGLALTVDVRSHGEAATLTPWVEEVAGAVGATVLVSDDADGFKTAADEGGLEHQVCKAHVGRNTEAWVKGIVPALAADADGSLAAIKVTPPQAVADAEALLRLMAERDPTPQAAATLEAIHRR